MSNLSAAQFNMIRRGSQAAVEQTRPVLGTIHKVADALGYQLGRNTEERVKLDANGNRIGGRIETSQGFGRKTTSYNRNGITGETRTRNSVPGPLGGRRTTTVVEDPPRYPPGPLTPPAAPGSPQPPAPGPPGPIRPLPIRGPFGPGGVGRGTVPTPQAPPVAPTPPYGTPLPFNRVRPQNLNEPFQGDNSPTVPLPFNGSPQGRSDYGNPFGTP